jgi:hypothetical protein
VKSWWSLIQPRIPTPFKNAKFHKQLDPIPCEKHLFLYPISSLDLFTSIFHYHPCFILRSGFFLSRFRTKIMYGILGSITLPKRCADFNCVDLVIAIISGEECKLCRSSLYSFLQFPVISSPLCRNVLLSSLQSNIHAHLRIFWYKCLIYQGFTFLAILYKLMLGLNIRFSTVFSNAFSVCFSSEMFLH